MLIPKVKVAILGGSGYTAVELMKLLLRHPFVVIAAVTSRQEPGKPVSADHPILFGRLDLPMENFDPDALKAKGVTCVFGCLPHGASAEAIAPLMELGMRVVDLSADYRLANPEEYQQWYGQQHHDLKNLKHAVYGLPELFRERISTAHLVANPGCYPQTAILGLAPLIREDLIDRQSIIIDSNRRQGIVWPSRALIEDDEGLAAHGPGHAEVWSEIERPGIHRTPPGIKAREEHLALVAEQQCVRTTTCEQHIAKGLFLFAPFIQCRMPLPYPSDVGMRGCSIRRRHRNIG